MDKVHFEYLGEDQTFDGSKVWKVEAIHVTTTRNKRMFTQAELEASGRSLSFRPLNINHDIRQGLSFPENATLAMNFNPKSMSVEGSFRVTDPTINALIETGRIKQVSIEQIPTGGESCNEIRCEQHGVAFIGMALLESDVMPGDPMANIKLEALLVSNAQRECTQCSDEIPCEACSNHSPRTPQSTLKEIHETYPNWHMTKVITETLSKCHITHPESASSWYEYLEPKYEALTSSL